MLFAQASDTGAPRIILGLSDQLPIDSPSQVDGRTKAELVDSMSTSSFGLHLSQQSSHGGSLVLSASTDTYFDMYYDANRVVSGHWADVNYSFGGSTILTAGDYQAFAYFGVQKFRKIAITNDTSPFPDNEPDGKPDYFRTVFSFTEEATIFPYGHNICNTNFTLAIQYPFYGTTDLVITMDSGLTHSSSRCYTSTNRTQNYLVLGKPLLQSAYMVVGNNEGLVSGDTTLYLTITHNRDLPPCPREFYSGEDLTETPVGGHKCGIFALVHHKHKALSLGAVADIVVGFVLVLTLLLGLIYFAWRRRGFQPPDEFVGS